MTAGMLTAREARRSARDVSALNPGAVCTGRVWLEALAGIRSLRVPALDA